MDILIVKTWLCLCDAGILHHLARFHISYSDEVIIGFSSHPHLNIDIWGDHFPPIRAESRRREWPKRVSFKDLFSLPSHSQTQFLFVFAPVHIHIYFVSVPLFPSAIPEETHLNPTWVQATTRKPGGIRVIGERDKGHNHPHQGPKLMVPCHLFLQLHSRGI